MESKTIVNQIRNVNFTHVGGPTLLIELGGIRILTDPTFDPPCEFQLPGHALVKLTPPVLAPADMLPIDLVILSHDHHLDNLDEAGRALLSHVPIVVTTESGSKRLGGRVMGLPPFQTLTFDLHGHNVAVMATPARHGPPGSEPLVGDVIGFLLKVDDLAPIYVSGDTVLYDDLDEILQHGRPSIGVLHMGRAGMRGMVFTMSASEGAELAERLGISDVVPVHYEGWAHLTESEDAAKTAFANAPFSGKVHWLTRGREHSLPISTAESAAP